MIGMLKIYRKVYLGFSVKMGRTRPEKEELSWVSIAVINNLTKLNLGRKEFVSAHSPS